MQEGFYASWNKRPNFIGERGRIVTGLIIRVNDHKAIQALILYNKDAQSILVEKAVIQFVAEKGTFGIADVLLENGIDVSKKTRKKSPGANRGRKSIPKKEKSKEKEVTPYSSALGDFEPI